MSTRVTACNIFAANGLIAPHLRGYQARPGQFVMAKVITEAIEDDVHTIVEGQAGTGKRLAYYATSIQNARPRMAESHPSDWFTRHYLPLAIIAFRQGVRRLIRSTSDRRVVVVLDSRLVTKLYFRIFLQDLRGLRVCRDLADIPRFLRSWHEETSR